MKHIVRDLLTLLISLFIWGSCKNPDEIGLDIAPADKIASVLVDTATVRAVTVKEDTIVTTGLSRHPLGNLNDPILGSTESSLAIALGMPLYGAAAFPKNSVLDSAILVMNYGKEFYGNTSLPFIVNVYQLAEKFNVNKNYNNFKAWTYNPTVIGSRIVGSYDLTDSITINDIVSAGPDTNKIMPPQLRIPIDKSFITTNFLKADSTFFGDNTRFNNYFKGLYVSVDKGNNSNGVVFFNLDPIGASGLEIYYRVVASNSIDTIHSHFVITRDSTAASIKHTYTAPVQTQLNNPKQQFNTVYTQPMGGLRTKLNFPYINNLKTSLGKVIVNKAELVISLDGSSDALYGPASRLILYRTDIADQRQPLPDNNSGQTQTSTDPRVLDPISYGGYYDKVNKRYKFVITSYIQDLLNGKLTQYDTFIAPISDEESLFKQIFSPATGSTAARSILGGGAGTYKMKLNIIYTKLK